MKLRIEEEVYNKVMYWVQKAGTKEVSGLGTIKIEGDSFKVISAMLLPQKNGATTTDIDPEAVCKAMYELRDAEGDLKWWWHSHVDMGVFWSGTDNATIKQFGDGGWVVATVFNKKKEMKTAFYSKDGQKTPLGVTSLFIDDIPTTIVGESKNTEAWDLEFKTNVTDLEARFTPSVWPGYANGWRNTYGGYGSYGDYGFDADEVYPGSSIVKATPQVKLTKAEKRELRKQQKAQNNEFVSDDYGFSPIDWNLLHERGYDIHEVDFLLSSGFKNNEVLKLAKEDVTPQEIEWFLGEKFSISDIMSYAVDGGGQ